MNKFADVLKRLFKFVWSVLTRRLWLKILSLILALILWTYIISTNTSRTRTKSFSGISVGTGSVSELSSRALSLATNVTVDYAEAIDVKVEVPQSQYSQLEAENITLTADFTGITAAGKYEVPLVGNSTYGTITRLSPSTILVTIEDQVSRNVSVELEIINADDEDYWYASSAATVEPKVITVSGPASIMRSVSRAVVQVDVSTRTTSLRRGYTTVSFKDSNDNDIPTQLLTVSTRASIVSLDIYPKKKLELYVDETQLHVPEGYQVTSVTLQPEAVVVAGSTDLLSSLDSLSVDVSDMPDASGTHSCKVVIPSDIKYCSASEVTLTVSTAPIEDQADEGE